MHMRAVIETEYKGEPSLGEDDQYSVVDIPRGSQVFELNNGVSTTLVFRDRKAIQREIPVELEGRQC